MVSVGSFTLMAIVEVAIAVKMFSFGVATRYWLAGSASVGYINVGLFKTNIYAYDNTVVDTPDFLSLVTGSSATAVHATRILVCFGDGCAILALILANLIIFRKRLGTLAAFMILSILSGVCTLVGVSLFHAHYSHLCPVSFSWVFTLLGSFLVTSSAVVMGCAFKRGEIQFGYEAIRLRLI